MLQRAVDRAAFAGVPLVLAPGIYRAGNVTLPAGAHLIGMNGAVRLVYAQGRALLAANGADRITLAGLRLDGGDRPLPGGRGLVSIANGRGIRITDCEVTGAGGQGVSLERVGGEVRGTTITGAASSGLFSLDARGLLVTGNTVRASGDNGIQIWRSQAGDDGTLVLANRIEDTRARSGGSGQNGNAVNVFRAANVVVSNNRISGAAFSAVRSNAASNLQITGNQCGGCGEVALYAEFGFEGAVISNNIVDGAAIGVAVTNFNDGGRMAVVQGNIIRRLSRQRPAGTDPGDGAGIGIAVEADAAVTGNVIEDAPTAGIVLGWGRHLRDLTVTGNVVRNAPVGIAVSVSPGAGRAVIANNLLANTPNGGIIGMELKRPVTGDLAKEGAAAHYYAQLAISGNSVR